MLQTKYLVAVVTIAMTLLNAMYNVIAGGIDAAEVWQLVVVAAGTGIAIVVPLVKGPWAGLFKTGFSVVAAIGATIAPFVVNGTITPEQIITVLIAAVNAIAVQIGVSVRTDEIKAAAAVIDGGTAAAGKPVNITSLPMQNAIATLAGDPAAAKVVLGDDSRARSLMSGSGL